MTRTILFVLLAILRPTASPGAEPRRVTNGPEPTQTIRYWHLKEQWRVGGSGQDLSLGPITDIVTDRSGNVYLLDSQQQTTFLFSPQGTLLRALGSRGDGPGETTTASRLLLAPGRLGVVNRLPARIIWLDTTGSPAGVSIPHIGSEEGGVLSCWSAKLKNDNLLLALADTQSAGSESRAPHFLATCPADGSPGNIHLELAADNFLPDARDGFIDESRTYNPLDRCWDQDSTGRVWIAPERDRYRLDAIDPNGQRVLTTTREFTPPPRTVQEKVRIRQAIDRQEGPPEHSVTVGDRAPCIGRLWIEEHPWGTEIWVESAASFHGLPPEVMVRYDLFDLEGRFTHQVDIVGQGDPLFDQWHLTGHNGLVMIRNASAGGYEDGNPGNPRFGDTDRTLIFYRILWEE